MICVLTTPTLFQGTPFAGPKRGRLLRSAQLYQRKNTKNVNLIYCPRHELSLNILIFTHYLVICRAQLSERVSMMFPHHSLCLGELLQYGLWSFLSLLLIEFWTPGQYLLTALYGKRGRHSENFTVFFITSIWIWMYPQKTSLNIVILF